MGGLTLPRHSPQSRSTSVCLEGLIHRGMPGLEGPRGESINRPWSVRVAEWIPGRLGLHYMHVDKWAVMLVLDGGDRHEVQ